MKRIPREVYIFQSEDLISYIFFCNNTHNLIHASCDTIMWYRYDKISFSYANLKNYGWKPLPQYQGLNVLPKLMKYIISNCKKVRCYYGK